MSLSQLAELACAKRSIDQVEQPASIQEPAEKKVRFNESSSATGNASDDSSAATTVEGSPEKSPRASSPQELERLMEKVRRRAQLRKHLFSRSSPPPPLSAPDLSASSSSDESEEADFDLVATMQQKLERLERNIKKSATLELHLMNKSKKLRDQRALLTRRYESMAQQLMEMQRAQPSNDAPTVFRMGRLPPLMAKTRRVSATKDQIVNHGL